MASDAARLFLAAFRDLCCRFRLCFFFFFWLAIVTLEVVVLGADEVLMCGGVLLTTLRLRAGGARAVRASVVAPSFLNTYC